MESKTASDSELRLVIAGRLSGVHEICAGVCSTVRVGSVCFRIKGTLYGTMGLWLFQQEFFSLV